MKKLSFVLILGILPIGAYAARTAPSTCDSGQTVPSGYCCIGYNENGSYTESLWNCDWLDLDAAAMAACKSEHAQCIDYCSTYDLDNATCSNKTSACTCNVWQPNWIEYTTDCTIPYAKICDYNLLTDTCGCGLSQRDEEYVWECIEGYYTTEDFQQCLPCPGDGIVDPDLINDVESVGIAACYIPRESMTGSDETGTFKYVNDKCHYKE